MLEKATVRVASLIKGDDHGDRFPWEPVPPRSSEEDAPIINPAEGMSGWFQSASRRRALAPEVRRKQLACNR